jgi:hypothetical protein
VTIKTRLVKLESLNKARVKSEFEGWSLEEIRRESARIREIRKQNGCPNCLDCIRPELCRELKQIEARLGYSDFV